MYLYGKNWITIAYCRYAIIKEKIKANIQIAIYGIENQTSVERYMPLRIAGDEGASYRSQYSLLNPKSGSSEMVNPVPVVTLILYFGTKEHWNQPKTLRLLMQIPDGLEDYINDCRIHVFEIAWLTDEEINRFHSDFRIMANFFAQKRRHADYVPNDKTKIVHVDGVLKLLSAMTGDHRYEEILADPSKKEVHAMCDVAERLVNKGKAEGRAEGKAEGIAEGRNNTVYEFVSNGLISPEVGAKELQISVEQLKQKMKESGFDMIENVRMNS